MAMTKIKYNSNRASASGVVCRNSWLTTRRFRFRSAFRLIFHASHTVRRSTASR